MSVVMVPPACCIPSKRRLHDLHASIVQSLDRPRVPIGSPAPEFVFLKGGVFRMGSDRQDALPNDGEGPSRLVTVNDFWIANVTVTNQKFSEFVTATDYLTEAERFGSSFVFERFLTERNLPSAAGTPWWKLVAGGTGGVPKAHLVESKVG